jgi:hypothetical protein
MLRSLPSWTLIRRRGSKMMNLTLEEDRIVHKLLLTDIIKWELGAENWDLTEEEEEKLWALIERLKAEGSVT